MKRLSSLVAALAATAVLGALLASGAQATTFTASSYPATGTGEQVTTNKFTFQGQTADCSKLHLEGSLSAASHTIIILPVYSECTAFGFSKAELLGNGCAYEFTIDNPSNSMHIKCPSGQTMTWLAGTCTIHIPEQTPTTNSIDYANNAGGILITFTTEGIHLTTTDGFLCPLNGSTETDTGGTYSGTVQFNGTRGKTVDIG